ncbi:MAG: transporter substrate-binding protein [Pseudomonadota bacterium]|nr:transporter substrate-binding protein [Pseudomonadota bacterium]
MKRRTLLRTAGVAATGLTAPGWLRAQASAPIRIGVMHSLTGTMAISEVILKETMLMAVDGINRAGGVMGRRLEPVVVDPASDWPTFARMTEQLVAQEKVAAIFGCWTSASRKAVLPALEKTGGLLYYPVQYEGQEQHPQVFYTGCAPNQQALPAVDYLMSAAGGARRRFVLLGTDYVYPRTTNAILRGYLKSKGVDSADILEIYRGFGHGDYTDILAQARGFAKGKPTAIVSTINGDSNLAFYRDLGRARITAQEMPSVAFSVGEEELRNVDCAAITGHLAAWNYFMSARNAMNRDFIARWSAYARERKLPQQSTRPIVNDPMQAALIGIHMWKQAVEKTQTTQVPQVVRAMRGQLYPAPSGELARMDEGNHHLMKVPMVGAIRADGQFDVVWKAHETTRAQPWSPYLAK